MFGCLVKVSGERAWGPGGGGVFDRTPVEYERPVLSGEGLGDGCCGKASMVGAERSKRIEAASIRCISLAIIFDFLALTAH